MQRANPLSPVSFFSHTQCGKISSEKSGKGKFHQARSAIKKKKKGQNNTLE
ncbi:MAG: hypothetical protein ACTSX0_13290 [Promethearchaeota archaeon]